MQDGRCSQTRSPQGQDLARRSLEVVSAFNKGGGEIECAVQKPEQDPSTVQSVWRTRSQWRRMLPQGRAVQCLQEIGTSGSCVPGPAEDEHPGTTQQGSTVHEMWQRRALQRQLQASDRHQMSRVLARGSFAEGLSSPEKVRDDDCYGGDFNYDEEQQPWQGSGRKKRWRYPPAARSSNGTAGRRSAGHGTRCASQRGAPSATPSAQRRKSRRKKGGWKLRRNRRRSSRG